MLPKRSVQLCKAARVCSVANQSLIQLSVHNPQSGRHPFNVYSLLRGMLLLHLAAFPSCGWVHLQAVLPSILVPRADWKRHLCQGASMIAAQKAREAGGGLDFGGMLLAPGSGAGAVELPQLSDHLLLPAGGSNSASQDTIDHADPAHCSFNEFNRRFQL